MGTVLITYRIMPERADTDLNNYEEDIKKKISVFGGEVLKVWVEHIAFGLKALHVLFALDEHQGDTEHLEHALEELHYIQSVEVVDVRRQIG